MSKFLVVFAPLYPIKQGERKGERMPEISVQSVGKWTGRLRATETSKRLRKNGGVPARKR